MKQRRNLNPDLENLIPILIGAWRRYYKEPGPPDILQTREFRRVVSAVKLLQQGFYGDQNLLAKDYFAQSDLLGAYLLYHFVIHYQQGLTLLGELPAGPRRVLDVCSGPAAFALAALRHDAHEVYAVDRNEEALRLGAEVCGRYGKPLTIRRWDCLKDSLPIEGQFDLIMVGHCLEELFPSTAKHWKENQEKFIHSLLKRLTTDGYLLLVESSHLEANRRILHLRDQLVKQGIPVQAPCVWRGECPALQTPNSPCYAQRELEKPYLLREIQRAAQINLGSLKMSYLILRHPEAGWPTLPEGRFYRVISPPVETYQGKRFYLCGTDGKKNITSHLQEHPQESRAFEYLKRGELISVENALEKQHAFEIVIGTKVKVEAPLGKPVGNERSPPIGGTSPDRGKSE